jgi:hypothetical protein
MSIVVLKRGMNIVNDDRQIMKIIKVNTKWKSSRVTRKLTSGMKIVNDDHHQTEIVIWYVESENDNGWYERVTGLTPS